MSIAAQNPPRHGEGDRAKRGGGDAKFRARPVVELARNLRKNQTLPERMLWQQLRQRPRGYKFRRQHPIGEYVVDFCCLAQRYVVEVDGAAHDQVDRLKFDERRTAFLNDNGYRVLRVRASRVLADAAETTDAIVARMESPLHQPAAGPPPRAGEAT